MDFKEQCGEFSTAQQICYQDASTMTCHGCCSNASFIPMYMPPLMVPYTAFAPFTEQCLWSYNGPSCVGNVSPTTCTPACGNCSSTLPEKNSSATSENSNDLTLCTNKNIKHATNHSIGTASLDSCGQCANICPYHIPPLYQNQMCHKSVMPHWPPRQFVTHGCSLASLKHPHLLPEIIGHPCEVKCKCCLCAHQKQQADSLACVAVHDNGNNSRITLNTSRKEVQNSLWESRESLSKMADSEVQQKLKDTDAANDSQIIIPSTEIVTQTSLCIDTSRTKFNKEDQVNGSVIDQTKNNTCEINVLGNKCMPEKDQTSWANTTTSTNTSKHADVDPCTVGVFTLRSDRVAPHSWNVTNNKPNVNPSNQELDSSEVELQTKHPSPEIDLDCLALQLSATNIQEDTSSDEYEEDEDTCQADVTTALSREQIELHENHNHYSKFTDMKQLVHSLLQSSKETVQLEDRTISLSKLLGNTTNVSSDSEPVCLGTKDYSKENLDCAFDQRWISSPQLQWSSSQEEAAPVNKKLKNEKSYDGGGDDSMTLIKPQPSEASLLMSFLSNPEAINIAATTFNAMSSKSLESKSLSFGWQSQITDFAEKVKPEHENRPTLFSEYKGLEVGNKSIIKHKGTEKDHVNKLKAVCTNGTFSFKNHTNGKRVRIPRKKSKKTDKNYWSVCN